MLTKGRFTLWTMKLDHGRWPFLMVWVHGPTSMVRLLENIVWKALGPSLGVNQMWTKKNDHAPKSECVGIFEYMLKRAILKKIQVWPFSCILLGFTCLHFLSKMCCKRGLQIFSQQFLQKKMKDLNCTCSMYFTCDLYLVLSLH